MALNAKDIVFTQEEQHYIEVSNIKVAMVPNIYPFNMYENGKLDGFSYDLLQLISKKSGLNFSFEIDNSSYDLNKFNSDQVESTDTDLMQTNDEIPLAIFLTKDLKNYNEMEDLKNIKTGFDQNLFYKNDPYITDFFEIIEHYGLNEKVKSLSFLDVDLLIGPLLNIQANIIKNGDSNIKVLRKLKLPVINKEDLRFGISKNNQLLYSIIKKSFDEISAQEWNDLNQKWTDVYFSKDVLTTHNTMTLSNQEKQYLKNKKTIKICTHHSLAPIDFLDKNSQLSGLSKDTLELLKKQMNIVFKYKKTHSLKESLSFLQQMKCDIIPSVDRSELLSKEVSFTPAYLSYKLAIITKKDNPFISGLEGIMDKTISLKRDSIFYKKIKTNFPNAKILETKSNHKALEAVNNKLAYFTISALPIASYYISKYTMSDLYISLYTDISYDIRMAIRSEDQILLTLLKKSLSQITSKQKKEISNRWISTPIKEVMDYSLIWKIMLIVLVILLILIYRQTILNKYNKELKNANEATKIKSLELELLTNNLEQRVKKEVQENEEKTNYLIHQSKLAQMGELISMIAHQWRQPLTSVSTTANYILAQSYLNKPLSKKELEDEVSLIIEYSQHLSTTIDDFRNFYKIDKEKINITIEEISDKSINIIKSSLETNRIKLEKNYNCFKKIHSYPTEINQVILNLLKNAEDILIEKQIEYPKIILNTYAKEGKVYLEVIDNGGGIEEEYFSKLFDPYFSTKDSKEGSGLGLYMSKTIIEDHCMGTLKVKNNELGATFSIII